MIRDLQILRAISVIAVVIYHYDKTLLPGGYLGVDCFFMISGYIITLTSIKSQQRGEFSVIRFYFKRFRRIVPAMFLMVVVTTMYSYLFFENSLYKLTSETLPFALFQVSNLKFLDGMSYFAPASHLNPLLHTWSLGVEEQFYLLFPFLFCIGQKLIRRSYGLLLLFVFFASLLFQVVLSNGHEFYNPIARVWLFMLGSFMAVRPPVWSRIVGSRVSGYLGLIVGFCLLSNHVHASFSSIWVGVFTCLVLAGIDGEKKANGSSGILEAIGDRSYSLYLWHWPVMTMYPAGQGSLLDIVAMVVVIAILTEISYRSVESYCRKVDLRFGTARTTILAYSSLAVAGIIAFGAPSSDTEYNRWKVEKGVLFDFKEHGGLLEIENSFGATDVDAILIGDSHGQVYLQPFIDFCESEDLTYKTYLSSGFYSLGERNFYAMKKSNSKFKDLDQKEYAKLLHQKILNQGSFDYVFIAQRFDCFYRMNNPHDSYTHLSFTKNKDPNSSVFENKLIFESDLSALVNSLTDQACRVVVLGQIPSQVEDPRDRPGISDFRPAGFYSDEFELIKGMQAAGLDFLYYNPRPDLEESFGDEAWTFYRDDDHLNLRGMDVLSNLIRASLVKSLNRSRN